MKEPIQLMLCLFVTTVYQLLGALARSFNQENVHSDQMKLGLPVKLSALPFELQSIIVVRLSTEQKEYISV